MSCRGCNTEDETHFEAPDDTLCVACVEAVEEVLDDDAMFDLVVLIIILVAVTILHEFVGG